MYIIRRSLFFIPPHTFRIFRTRKREFHIQMEGIIYLHMRRTSNVLAENFASFQRPPQVPLEQTKIPKKYTQACILVIILIFLLLH